jgi:hypothetical protein
LDKLESDQIRGPIGTHRATASRRWSILGTSSVARRLIRWWKWVGAGACVAWPSCPSRRDARPYAEPQRRTRRWPRRRNRGRKTRRWTRWGRRRRAGCRKRGRRCCRALRGRQAAPSALATPGVVVAWDAHRPRRWPAWLRRREGRARTEEIERRERDEGGGGEGGRRRASRGGRHR